MNSTKSHSELYEEPPQSTQRSISWFVFLTLILISSPYLLVKIIHMAFSILNLKPNSPNMSSTSKPPVGLQNNACISSEPLHKYFPMLNSICSKSRILLFLDVTKASFWGAHWNRGGKNSENLDPIQILDSYLITAPKKSRLTFFLTWIVEIFLSRLIARVRSKN